MQLSVVQKKGSSKEGGILRAPGRGQAGRAVELFSVENASFLAFRLNANEYSRMNYSAPGHSSCFTPTLFCSTSMEIYFFAIKPGDSFSYREVLKLR